MVIDVRTRIETARDPLSASLDASPEAHRAAMRCVDAAIIVGYRADRLSMHTPSEGVAGVVNEDPDRRLGLAGVDPLSASALDDIDQAVELGLVGVTIAPADQGCRATHDRCLAVLERCALRRLPVLAANPMINHPESVLEFARPASLDEAVRQTPGLTLILGDLGHGWVDEGLLLVAKHERVFAEISGLIRRPWALYDALLTAHERGLTEKLLFGSGFPELTPEQAIERIYTVNAFRAGSALPTIPRESLRQIVERDALETLGVDHLFSRATPKAKPETQATPAQVVVAGGGGRVRHGANGRA